jgi:hypothetical protein
MGLETAVKMTGIVKKFPGVIANDHVNLDINFGEVHALLGETVLASQPCRIFSLASTAKTTEWSRLAAPKLSSTLLVMP